MFSHIVDPEITDRGCRGRAPPGIATKCSAAAIITGGVSDWRYIAYARYSYGQTSGCP